MRLLFASSCITASLLAAPVAAQPAQGPAPASAEQIASASAEADRIAQAGGASDLFENVTNDASPTLRHTRSGMTCLFEAGVPGNSVRIYPDQGTGIPRGDDVSCGTTISGVTVTMFATRYPQPTSLNEQMQGTLAAVQRNYQNVRPSDQPGIGMSLGERPGGPALPERQTATLLATVQGQPVVTRISIAIHNGWVIKQRITTPGQDVMQADLVGELFMTTTLLRLVDPTFGRNGAARATDPAPKRG